MHCKKYTLLEINASAPASATKTAASERYFATTVRLYVAERTRKPSVAVTVTV